MITRAFFNVNKKYKIIYKLEIPRPALCTYPGSFIMQKKAAWFSDVSLNSIPILTRKLVTSIADGRCELGIGTIAGGGAFFVFQRRVIISSISLLPSFIIRTARLIVALEAPVLSSISA